MNLAWSKNPPTVAGWYWRRINDSDTPIIVQVLKRPGHEYLAICEVNFHERREFYAVAKMNIEWAGPIEPPATTTPPACEDCNAIEGSQHGCGKPGFATATRGEGG